MKLWKLALGLALVAAALAVILLAGPAVRRETVQPEIKPQKSVTVHIRFGSEKKGLLDDAEFRKIMLDKFGLVIDGTKMGSLEMSQGPFDGIDGLWPSSELAAQVFKRKYTDISHKTANIFNTPILFYSWPEITAALIKAGIVEKRDGAYYVINMHGLLTMIVEKRTWRSLELNRQNGYVSIHSTDPTKSNSGFLLTGLMAVILNNGEMVTSENLPAHLSAIKNIYQRMGFLESSTGILFDKYIKQGQGAFPLVAAYESLILEFYQAYPDYRGQIKDSMRFLIPEPTVWSEHPFIALTANGERLMNALQDGKIQEIAWSSYGFRSGVMGINNDPAILEEVGLPERIAMVTPLPSPDVMEEIIGALQSEDAGNKL